MVAFTLHELAHYLVATISGVRAESVIIGFGREIWHRRGANGTRWSIRLFPVCGRVHLHAHSAAEAAAGPKTRLFQQQPWPVQAGIVAAGPVGNFVTAFVALALFYTAAGLPSIPPVVSGVRLDGPAARAGVLPGDEIVAVDGRPVRRFETVTRMTVAGRPMVLTLRRGDRIVQASFTPEYLSWRDEDGFARGRGMAGLLTSTAPFRLAQIEAVDGVPMQGDADKTRRLLLAKLGGTARLTAHVNDKTARDYLVDVPRPPNLALGQPAPVQGLRLSVPRETFYDAAGAVEAAQEAMHETGRLTAGFAFIFSHTWPFDVTRIKPETTVAVSTAPVRATAYVFVHKIAEWSVCLALINLVPIPGTDGWFILYIVAGGLAGRQRAPIVRLRVIQLVLFGLLAAWTVLNVPVMLAVVR